jgi:hypothetical protein
MTNYVSLFSNINIMKTAKVRHRKNKRHGKNRVKHKSNKSNKSNKSRTHTRKIRAGATFTNWVGSGLGYGGTGFNHLGNIFKQLAKRTILIN